MAVPTEAPLPPGLDLGPGFTLRVTALSTTTGAVVSGVTVNNFGVTLNDLGAGSGVGVLEVGPFMLVPGPGA